MKGKQERFLEAFVKFQKKRMADGGEAGSFLIAFGRSEVTLYPFMYGSEKERDCKYWAAAAILKARSATSYAYCIDGWAAPIAEDYNYGDVTASPVKQDCLVWGLVSTGLQYSCTQYYSGERKSFFGEPNRKEGRSGESRIEDLFQEAVESEMGAEERDNCVAVMIQMQVDALELEMNPFIRDHG